MPETTAEPRITSDMTVLDVIAEHPATKAVFHGCDNRTGACTCRDHLFEASCGSRTNRLGLNLAVLLKGVDDPPHPEMEQGVSPAALGHDERSFRRIINA